MLPLRVGERAGDGFWFAQTLETHSANLFSRVGCQHQFDGPEFAFDSPGGNCAEVCLLLKNTIQMERIFVPGEWASQSLPQLSALSAQNPSLNVITGGVWEKSFQVSFGLTPGAERRSLGRFSITFEKGFS